ncbi:MAG: PIN domain-containing protein [Terracidiphilus sp.]|jgi:predicted nucleic acid-binding protein
MGLILDSSVIIAAERQRETPSQLMRHIATLAGDQDVAISTIGLTEIVHAIYRAPSIPMQLRRQAFIHDLLAYVDVLPYTRSTAWLAGKIDGEQRFAGVTIPSMNLLIGATALEAGYAIVTANVRHFQLIPDLKVVAL